MGRLTFTGGEVICKTKLCYYDVQLRVVSIYFVKSELKYIYSLLIRFSSHVKTTFVPSWTVLDERLDVYKGFNKNE